MNLCAPFTPSTNRITLRPNMNPRHSPNHDAAPTSNTLTSHAPIRRNLFAHQPRFAAQTQTQSSRAPSSDHLSHARVASHPRRAPQTTIPPPSAPVSTAMATPTPTARYNNNGNLTGPDATAGLDGIQDEEDDDIVVRDAQGNITVEGFDNVSVATMSIMMKGPGGIGARVAGLCMNENEEDEEGGLDDDGLDVANSDSKIDTKLIELYRGHSRQHIDQSELKAQVEASLRAKVASLDDDRWMYEEEEEDRDAHQ